MEPRCRRVVIGSLVMAVLAHLALASRAEADDGDDGERGRRTPRREAAAAPRLGLALEVDALGAGGDVAVAVARRLNLRVGVRALDVAQRSDLDGIDLAASVRLRSASAYLDWFPFGGSFHLSPGAMIYNGNRATAAASVPAGQTFTIGGSELVSSPMDPVRGSAAIDFPRVAPALVIGWGNIVPRRGHWSVPFQLGVVYVRSPSTTLDLRGTACTADGSDCRDLARDPLMQALVRAEEASLDDRLAPLKVLPIVSLGVGYRF